MKNQKPKRCGCRGAGRLCVRLRDVKKFLTQAMQRELSRDALQRLRWIAYALEHGENVSLTCRHFGIARSTFLRWAKRFDPLDPLTLEGRSRRPHHFRRPETEHYVIALIRAYRKESPLMGKEAIREKLAKDHGMTVSLSTVGRVISRHGFFFADTPSHRQKRINNNVEPFGSEHVEGTTGGPSDESFPLEPELGFDT